MEKFQRLAPKTEMYSPYQTPDHVLDVTAKSLWHYVLDQVLPRLINMQYQFLQFPALSNNSNTHATQGALPPVTEDTVFKFITFCTDILYIQASTISVDFTGIRSHYIKAGFKFCSSSWERLPYIQKANKRKQGHGASKLLPITFDILSKVSALLRKECFHLTQMLCC